MSDAERKETFQKILDALQREWTDEERDYARETPLGLLLNWVVAKAFREGFYVGKLHQSEYPHRDRCIERFLNNTLTTAERQVLIDVQKRQRQEYAEWANQFFTEDGALREGVSEGEPEAALVVNERRLAEDIRAMPRAVKE